MRRLLLEGHLEGCGGDDIGLFDSDRYAAVIFVAEVEVEAEVLAQCGAEAGGRGDTVVAEVCHTRSVEGDVLDGHIVTDFLFAFEA